MHKNFKNEHISASHKSMHKNLTMNKCAQDKIYSKCYHKNNNRQLFATNLTHKSKDSEEDKW